MDKSLNNEVTESVKDTYFKELNNKYTGFLGVTCRDILDRLLDVYRKIMTAYLEANNQKMNKQI